MNLNDSRLLRIEEGEKSVTYFCRKLPVGIDRELILTLKEKFHTLKGKNLRVCLHNGPEADFHEMVILEGRDKYYRPHRHLTKGESCHIIEGELAFFVFKDDGSVAQQFRISDGENLICRADVNQWHVVIPITEYIIYHEAKPGPFLGNDDSIYPDWAPDGSDVQSAFKYMQELLDSIRKIKRGR